MAGNSPPPSKTASLDRPLHAVGFEYDLLSPERLTGRLTITESCCQPFKVLHGGVTAMIAEGMASMGAYIASGFQRVAGVQLSTNHIKAARLGELVHVEAVPIQQGRTIQVWEVQLWKIDPSTSGDKKVLLLSTSRVTLLCNLPASKEMKGFEDTVKKYAKL
ncbi:1,4-dihydroxy-2-naphthoyl-CoA thioesterase 1-like [Phalaenopsis equestris]|uniref:1,4-dihydroxy-2-naphthoyl-CoA thioesterase 1-like n=1 Tax=Phalaenopsis equestris TaxID=78828 RepID=UPI0009E594D0|nr:1,4-dihydroxy-2-naphthoyl-CoA thioesterase 1-like [Phalaenopsis equestris]